MYFVLQMGNIEFTFLKFLFSIAKWDLIFIHFLITRQIQMEGKMEEKDHLNCKISAFFTTPTPATAIIRTITFTAQK